MYHIVSYPLESPASQGVLQQCLLDGRMQEMWFWLLYDTGWSTAL